MKSFEYPYLPEVRYELTINEYWPNDTVYITYKVYRGDTLLNQSNIQIEQRDQIQYMRDQLTEILNGFDKEDQAYNEYCERSKQAVNDNFDNLSTIDLGSIW